MRFFPRLIPALVAILIALSTVHCQAIDLPPSQNIKAGDIQGWPEQIRQQWYHTSAGTQLIPYDWFVTLIENESLLTAFGVTGILSNQTHPDKLPVGFAKIDRGNSSSAMVGFTCAFCHTSEFTYKNYSFRIEGGPSLQYNARFLQILMKSLGELIPPDVPAFMKSLKESNPPDKFKAFATRVLARRGEAMTPYTLTALGIEVTMRTQALLSRGGKDISPEQWGPGRFDALGRGGNTVFVPLSPDNLRPANASVSIPPLWGVWEYDWVQWSGSIQHPLARNIAQVIGVNAGLFAWTQTATSTPSEKSEIFRSSVDLNSLKLLENLARRLPPPRWPSVFPAIDRALAARGKDLYHGNKGKGIQNLCAHCHVATPIKNSSPSGPSLHVTVVPLKEIGTDSLYLENFSRRTVDTGPLQHGRISAKDASELITNELMAINGAAEDPEYQHLTNRWRDTAQYIARPHVAVWATAPFLHNGSIPNLYELLSPARERHGCFYLSPSMQFDPENVGFVIEECTGSPAARNQLGGFEFKTQFPGNGNGGHEFANVPGCENGNGNGVLGCELPVEDRRAIIEYLKTCDLDRLVIREAPVCRDIE
ncbi:MAG: hypothetical protein KIT40_05245 [Nitrospira sp.]|nr:hypothetical protein [Nitrospira sp.]